MKSTRLRNSPKAWSLIIGQKIEELMGELDTIRNHTMKLRELLSLGFMLKGRELLDSSEYKELASDILPSDTCSKSPPEIDLAEGKAKPLHFQDQTQVTQSVKNMSDGDLRQKCVEFSCSAPEGSSRTELEEAVVYSVTHVSEYNRFGKCKSAEECSKVTPNTRCEKSVAEKAGFSRGRCQCAEKYCYTFHHETGKEECISTEVYQRKVMTEQVQIHFRDKKDFRTNFTSRWPKSDIKNPWSIGFQGTKTHEWYDMMGNRAADIRDPLLQDGSGDPEVAEVEAAVASLEEDLPFVMNIEHDSVFRRLGHKIDQWMYLRQIQIGSFIKRLDYLSLHLTDFR